VTWHDILLEIAAGVAVLLLTVLIGQFTKK